MPNALKRMHTQEKNINPHHPCVSMDNPSNEACTLKASAQRPAEEAADEISL